MILDQGHDRLSNNSLPEPQDRLFREIAFNILGGWGGTIPEVVCVSFSMDLYVQFLLVLAEIFFFKSEKNDDL